MLIRAGPGPRLSAARPIAQAIGTGGEPGHAPGSYHPMSKTFSVSLVLVCAISSVSAVHAQTIGANNGHTVVAKPDGSAWAWGTNGNGEIGDNSTTRRDVPTQVSGLTSGVIAVCAGANHSLALKSDGTVWAWGYNGNGQLGLGDTTRRLIPVQISTLSNVVAIAAGANHSLAVKSDGTCEQLRTGRR